MVSNILRVYFSSFNLMTMMVEKVKHPSIALQKQRKHGAIDPQTMIKLEFFYLGINFYEIIS